ncbi:MAG: hypothetical protein L3J96_07155, partial [Thermoplasmata archaeon]|nr:hypothetical protein [Thermoplasmata archaeon]
MDLLARPRWLPGGGRTRRYLVLIVLVLVAVMALPPAPSAPTPARSLDTVAPVPAASGSGHWTAFHGGENHSGFSPENGPSVGTLSWLFAPPTGNPIRTGIVANGSAIFFADDFGVVWAYN